MFDRLAKRRLIYPVRKLGLFVASHWPFSVKAKLVSGQDIWVDTRSAIGRAILVKGEFDPAVWGAIEQYLPAGGVFFDIGANIGYYSILASAHIGPLGKVHAFEIDPRPLRCLRKNSSICPDHNIHIHEAAVGEKEGQGFLHAAPDCGHSRVQSDGMGASVPITSLNGWVEAFPELNRIDVIKIDIEGGELAALMGAKGVIEKFHPVIVCEALDELTDEGVSHQDQLISFFSTIGYKTVFIEGVYSPTLLARHDNA